MSSRRKVPKDRQQWLIVDGHSMIFALPDLKAFHRKSNSAARIELEKRLVRYQDITEVSVVIVFDGAGERTRSERKKAGVQVIYSDQGCTADDVIERLAAKYAKNYELTVATDDYAERETVRSYGAFAIGSEMFLDQLEASKRGFEERLRKHRKG